MKIHAISDDVYQELMAWFGKLKDWEGVGDPPVEKLRAAPAIEVDAPPFAEALSLNLTNAQGLTAMFALALIAKEGAPSTSGNVAFLASVAKDLAFQVLDDGYVVEEAFAPKGAEALRWGDSFSMVDLTGRQRTARLVAVSMEGNQGTTFETPDSVLQILGAALLPIPPHPIMGDFKQPAGVWTIEPHGPEGQFALYEGRSPLFHGSRLCNLSDFDANGAKTMARIVSTAQPRGDVDVEGIIRAHMNSMPVNYDLLTESIHLAAKINAAHALANPLKRLYFLDMGRDGKSVAIIVSVDDLPSGEFQLYIGKVPS